eukprot:223124-Lingulodinium_polyedra.AAC.1
MQAARFGVIVLLAPRASAFWEPPPAQVALLPPGSSTSPRGPPAFALPGGVSVPGCQAETLAAAVCS